MILFVCKRGVAILMQRIVFSAQFGTMFGTVDHESGLATSRRLVVLLNLACSISRCNHNIFYTDSLTNIAFSRTSPKYHYCSSDT